MSTLRLREVWPGVFKVTAPFSRELNALIKSDRRWWAEFGPPTATKPKGQFKAWHISAERLDELEGFACNNDWEFQVTRLAPGLLPQPDNTLTKWQQEGLERALTRRVSLSQWVTGSGKSRGALEVYRALPTGSKVLIVCPKVVMRTWEDQQLPKWLPQPPVSEGEKPAKPSWWSLIQGRKIPDEQPDITLVSYGSLHRVPKDWRFDLLIFDELHAGIHGDSKRSQHCVDLSMRHGKAIRLGLTATPTSSSLTDLWSQMNILCPHRWGTFKRWWQEYFVAESVGFEDHVKPGPLKQDKLPALLKELETICHYVGHEDVGDALPPVEWKEKRYGDPAAGVSTPETVKQWVLEQRAIGGLKVDAFIREWGRMKWDSVQPMPPTAIVVYHRDLGERLAERLGATYVSGEMPPKQRHVALAEAQLAVVTMRSVTEGLDLRRFTNVHVLEAYPVPLYLTQVLGRFVRLYATEPVTITFWRMRGSSDDIIVHRLLQRMSEHGKVLRSGGKVESGLQALLTLDHNSDAFLQELRDAVALAEPEDEKEDWESFEDWDD